MRTLLICHEEEPLNRFGLARWLGSFSELKGILILKESRRQKRRRIRRELKRVGFYRFLDVAAFRLYYRFFLAAKDRAWEQDLIGKLCRTYPPLPADTPLLEAPGPNTPEAEAFIRRLSPDVVIARCKQLLKERIFTIPATGTFVMHPGICPEYRNAHGCFWALASRDLQKVGMTLLRVDRGVDTGPVFGYYFCSFNEAEESHMVIQNRVVFENLDNLRDKLIEIHAGIAEPLQVNGRPSGTWGQPWLSRYIQWKRHARASHTRQ